MLADRLGLQPGITTVIGSGGKTTLLRCLGRELSDAGHRVVLCTTTKIFPFSDIPCITAPSLEAVEEALQARSLVCVGKFLPELGKLTAPEMPLEELRRLAAFVLVEGDGSKHLPLKAHDPQEPVIPAKSNQTICVVGLSGIGKPVKETVHRAERFCALSGLTREDPVTVESVAKVLRAENLADQYLLNQLDAVDRLTAETLIDLLHKKATALSLALRIYEGGAV